jgi:hypothetical protein
MFKVSLQGARVAYRRDVPATSDRKAQVNVTVECDGVRVGGFFPVDHSLAVLSLGDFVDVEGSIVGTGRYVNWRDVTSVQVMRLVPVKEVK